MKKKNIFAILVLCTHLCFSQTKPITQKDAVSVFESLTNLQPIKCMVQEFDGKETIFCLADKRGSQNEVFTNPDIIFYKLSSFANAWRVETQQPIFKEQYKYCQFLSDLEVNLIDEEPYLYFVYSLADVGTSAGNLETLKFSLLPLNTYKLISLDYTGDARYDKKDNFQFIKDGSFDNIDTLKNEPGKLSFFEEKVKNSPFIYHPTKKDLDINNPDNNEKKWVLDNPNAIEKVYSFPKAKIIGEPLKITYYDKNLFTDNNGSIINRAENVTYKFISYFKGSIVGFNKITKKYFPIWVESCNEGCNKDISFISPNTLKIKYINGDQIVTINLNKLIYTLSYSTVPIQNQTGKGQIVKNATRHYSAFNDELLINKSQNFIQNSLKAPRWHYSGSQMNDFNLLVLHYTCTYKPEKIYPFQVSFYYWVDPDTKNTVRCFVEFPTAYLRYMISRLQGYVQVDDTHFQSTDGNIGVGLSRDGSQCAVEFFRNK